jgi:hypothetical protein
MNQGYYPSPRLSRTLHTVSKHGGGVSHMQLTMQPWTVPSYPSKPPHMAVVVVVVVVVEDTPVCRNNRASIWLDEKRRLEKESRYSYKSIVCIPLFTFYMYGIK